MDFYKIKERELTVGRGRNKEVEAIEIYPDFVVGRSKDLMIRGNKFLAIWDEEKGMWSTDEHDVQRIVDADLYGYRDAMKRHVTDKGDVPVTVKAMAGYSSGSWSSYRRFLRDSPDCCKELDSKLTFADTVVKREDYVSKRLPYSLVDGDYSAWDKLVGRLYEPEERRKIEWAIGAIVSGDSKSIQKFLVLYGEGGTGKSTIIEIIDKLFTGYTISINAKAIGMGTNRFALEMFRSNPLVALEADSKLDRIDDNTKLNSIIAHEKMVIDEKGKPTYEARANCFLILGSNNPVQITDGRSGLIRRLIDVVPTGNIFPAPEYEALVAQIDFELGAIAKHCLNVYRSLGKHYYNGYRSRQMMSKTNPFYNFVDDEQNKLEDPDGISLDRAYDIYLEWCKKVSIEKPMRRYIFKDELKVYYKTFREQLRVNGEHKRNWYFDFRKDKLEPPVLKKQAKPLPMVLDCTHSLFDDLLADSIAQYETDRNGEVMPEGNWASCKTTLKDLDTSKTHYIHGKALTDRRIVTVDFDLKDEQGNKSMLLNLEAASKWPLTYAEFSKSGCGIHLEYFYNGDLDKLSPVYAPGIEIKVFRGNAALRRRLSKCNNLPIATLEIGALPVKEEKVLDVKELKDEIHLRNVIKKCLRKENHGATKPEIDLIDKVLSDAYRSGLHYDVSDLYHDILVFAMNSTNNSDYCIKKLLEMRLQSRDIIESEKQNNQNDALDRRDESRRINGTPETSEAPIIFLDCEVFPNLFLVNWKFEGEGQPVHRMINPTPGEIEALFKYRIVGFNCRKYDNHMLYGRFLGLSNEELYDLSQRIIVQGARDAFYPEAYDISYTDIYDYSKTKQSLKKWEIQLGIHHKELGLPWDQPVPETLWTQVAEYCDNDVIATEAVWNATKADFVAREILADVAELSVNDTTNALTTRIIFGRERNPQKEFNYRFMGDLKDVGHIYDSEIERLGLDPEYTMFDSKGRPLFPGYTYSFGKSVYRGEEVGEGGYVFATTGIFADVPVIDVASMHPSSILDEDLFGPRFTQRFREIVEARICIKHKDYDRAAKLLEGKLAKYLTDKNSAKALAGALKIAINSVYGLTAARFVNPFRDQRNVDNIVAKRGALFMVNLKHEVQRRGYTVVHIKTDSIKIANATPEIIQFCMDYGKLYGYNFEHESTYDRICLVNDAVYIAQYADRKKCDRLYGYIPEKNEDQYRDGVRIDNGWTATGAQFAQPYVFKTLFSAEPLSFADYCEAKSVSGSAIYLDMNEGYPDVTAAEEELDRRIYNAEHPDKKPKKLDPNYASFADDDIRARIGEGHNYQFVGRTGLFYPIREGCHGGIMYREKDGKYYAVTGTKGYRWLEAETVLQMHKEEDLDPRYHQQLASDAIATIEQFGHFETFVNQSESPFVLKEEIDIPVSVVPCGDGKYNTCLDCPSCVNDQCRRGYSLANYIH